MSCVDFKNTHVSSGSTKHMFVLLGHRNAVFGGGARTQIWATDRSPLKHFMMGGFLCLPVTIPHPDLSISSCITELPRGYA